MSSFQLFKKWLVQWDDGKHLQWGKKGKHQILITENKNSQVKYEYAVILFWWFNVVVSEQTNRVPWFNWFTIIFFLIETNNKFSLVKCFGAVSRYVCTQLNRYRGQNLVPKWAVLRFHLTVLFCISFLTR